MNDRRWSDAARFPFVVMVLLASGCSAPPSLPDLAEVPPFAPADAPEETTAEIARLRAAANDPAAYLADRGRSFGRLGMYAQAFGFPDAALAAYDNAHDLEPGDHRWAYYLGHLSLEKGDFDAAVRWLELAAAERSEDAIAQLAAGQANLQAGRTEAAAGWFDKSAGLEPELGAAIVGQGDVALRRGAPATAVKRFEAALALHPEATSIRLRLAEAYRALGELERATEYAASGAGRGVPLYDPLLWEVEELKAGGRFEMERGGRLFARGDWAGAEAAFRNAVDFTPGNALAWQNLGAALTRLERFEEAVTALERSLEIEGENDRTWFNLGTLQLRQGRYDDSAVSLQRALELNPGNASAAVNEGHALLRSRRLPEAAESYAAARRIDASLAAAWLGEAIALSLEGGRDEARALLEEAVHGMPDKASLRIALARVLAARPVGSEDGKRALELLAPLLRGRIASGTAQAAAMAHAAAGDFPQAIAWQERFVQALEAGRPSARLERARQVLTAYRAGEPARRAWDWTDLLD